MGTKRRSAATASSHAGLTTGRLAAMAWVYASSRWPPLPDSSPPVNGEEHTKCVVASWTAGASRALICSKQPRNWLMRVGGWIEPKVTYKPVRLLVVSDSYRAERTPWYVSSHGGDLTYKCQQSFSCTVNNDCQIARLWGHLQDQLECVFFAALEATCFPLQLLILCTNFASDPAPPLTVAVHLQPAETGASEVQGIPLESDTGLRDILDLEDRLRGRGCTIFLQNRLLQSFKGVSGCSLCLHVPGHGDGEDRARSQWRVIGRRSRQQERGKLQEVRVWAKKNGLRGELLPTTEERTIPASSFPSVKVTGPVSACSRRMSFAHSHFSDLECRTALGEPRWRASTCDMLLLLVRVLTGRQLNT